MPHAKAASGTPAIGKSLGKLAGARGETAAIYSLVVDTPPVRPAAHSGAFAGAHNGPGDIAVPVSGETPPIEAAEEVYQCTNHRTQTSRVSGSSIQGQASPIGGRRIDTSCPPAYLSIGRRANTIRPPPPFSEGPMFGAL